MGQSASKNTGTTATAIPAVGATGAQGIQGLQGLQGDKGDKGDTGAASTVIGPIGPMGLQGIQGGIGLTGPQGPKGDIGLTGAQGPKGDMGLTGLQGALGPQGATGPIGLVGATGLQGLVGPQGAKGDRGTDGEVSKAFLKSNGVWCENNVCTFPDGKQGINYGANNSKIFNDGKTLNVASDQGINVLVNNGTRGLYVNPNNVVIANENKPEFTGLNIKRRDNNWTHFDWYQDGKNYIRGDTVMDNGGIRFYNGYGEGPYKVKLYRKNQCLDSGQFSNTQMGGFQCQDNNDYQNFYLNSVTGQLKENKTGKCLDTSNNVWQFQNCDINNENQRFWRWENQLKSRNGDCLDTGNTNHHAKCDGNEANQLLYFF